MTVFDMVAYALLFVGTPYGWGKDGGGQFDCSGFIQEVLAFDGHDPKGDQTADGLMREIGENYTIFFEDENGFDKIIKHGSILFFGKRHRATHVAMAINKYQMVEAGGGGRKTITTEDAKLHAAMVRIRQIKSRSDLMAVINL